MFHKRSFQLFLILFLFCEMIFVQELSKQNSYLKINYTIQANVNSTFNFAGILEKPRNSYFIYEENTPKFRHIINHFKTLLEEIQSENKETINIYIVLHIILPLLIFLYFYKQTNIFTKNKTYPIDSKLEQKILEGLDKIEESYCYLENSFSMGKFAKKLKTNTSYVSYIINKVKGKTFKEYYTSLRIKYIIEKLENDKNYRKYTIKYMGELIGYTNASAFTRAFKKHNGITPSEFIKKLDINKE